MSEIRRNGQRITEDEAASAAKAAQDAVDPDRACGHPDFESNVAVGRITEVDGGPVVAFMADITVSCLACGEHFRWTGLEPGMSFEKPLVSLNGLEMHAPLRPASSDPDFGMGLPGFTVQIRDER